MSTAVRAPDPGYLDRLIKIGARAARRAAPGPQKHYAHAIGVRKTRANAHLNGDRHSPPTRWLEMIDRLARGEHTSPWPVIAEGIAVAMQAQLQVEPVDDLKVRRMILRWIELSTIEHERVAQANERAQMLALTGDLEGLAEADVAEAEIRLERAALSRELARLGLNPMLR